jgi:hypothetical protein
MIKLTNAYLAGIIAATLLVGCGGGSDSNGSADDGSRTSTPTTQPVEPNNGNGGGTTATPPPAAPTASSAKKFGSNVMPILNAKCKVCHGSNGRFTITTTSSTYNNITALKGSAKAGGQYLLSKGSGTVGHGGGTVISTSSAEYATIKSWVNAGAANN